MLPHEVRADEETIVETAYRPPDRGIALIERAASNLCLSEEVRIRLCQLFNKLGVNLAIPNALKL